MISSNDFKTGVTIEVDGNLLQVLEFQHVKPGKGAAFVRCKLKNLRNGSVLERTFRAGETVPRAHVETREMQFLYSSGDEYTFMDTENYEQINLDVSQLKWEKQFLIDNMLVDIQQFKGEIIGIDLPNSVELKVVDADPSVKGNTVTGASKTAVMETGVSVQVPLFINEGDVLIIDTREGKYVSRA